MNWLFDEGTFLSEDTDVFVKYPNILFFELWILVTENCLEIEDVLNFESLEAFKGKKVTFGWLGLP